MITLYDIAMRTIVDIPEEQLDELKDFCEQEDISRAEAIRRAIQVFLKQVFPKEKEEAFGIWKDKTVDSLKYQKKLRDEWE